MERSYQTARNNERSNSNRTYSSNSENSFASRYNFYDGNKHFPDYLYPITNDVLGSWKHYNLSADTLNYRNMRSKNALVTREINRYYEKKPNYIGDTSCGGATDFRHYNYRFGDSDEYRFMKLRLC